MFLCVIEQKNHLEEGNKMLIQSFQTLLAQHLEILHKIIVSSVTHQEQQLNAIEENMKSFVTEQDKVNCKIYLSNLREIADIGFRLVYTLSNNSLWGALQ